MRATSAWRRSANTRRKHAQARAHARTQSQNKTHLIFSFALVHVPPPPAVSAASFVLRRLCVCQMHRCQLHKLPNPHPALAHPIPRTPHPARFRTNLVLRRKRQDSNSFSLLKKTTFSHRGSLGVRVLSAVLFRTHLCYTNRTQ